MDFLRFLKENTVLLDGGMGTLLQKYGLGAGEAPEKANLTHPDWIREIHKAYFDAGSNVICTNTFGANSLKYDKNELQEIVSAAVRHAKAARSLSVGTQEKFIALDLGPTGRLLKPLGDLDFEDAVSAFRDTVEIGAACGVDLIFIETMNDSYESKAAILAAKEASDLPIILSNAYSESGTLMTGATPEAMVALAEGLGVCAIGANCSLGPKQLSAVMERLLSVAEIPVIFKPNAGLPKIKGDKTLYDITPEEFASEVYAMMKKGVRAAGGCCGTTPEYIARLSCLTEHLLPTPIEKKNRTVISSYTHAVQFGNAPILIGERINPTGKKRFRQALLEHDLPYLLSEGIKQEEKGAQVLDVNVGLPEIDEPSLLCEAVCALQAITSLPLQIDTASPEAMERALRRYNGKALINSVNGKEESMRAIFPLVKHYGGTLIALTLDESGIPDTSRGRIAIAKKILARASEYGIDPRDIIFDPLAMTVSADADAAKTTLASLRAIRDELHCHSSLGVSNVSFGLPARDVVNATFFALALEEGLSAAIMNPFSEEMMRCYFAFCALKGWDENCAGYIRAAEAFSTLSSVATKEAKFSEQSSESALQHAILKGMGDAAAEAAEALLKTKAPLAIVNEEIIPALNTVGAGFEEKKIYLPQLLMSAEAAKSAFEVLKSQQNTTEATRGTIVLATVKGDIHDIGKNIVKLLMENYGFRVIDLGKDVSAQEITDAVCQAHAPLLGLSALMTTTVPAMEETIRLVRTSAPWCKVMVGGAVLTEEYAKAIGADFYAKDALEGVRLAQEYVKE